MVSGHHTWNKRLTYYWIIKLIKPLRRITRSYFNAAVDKYISLIHNLIIRTCNDASQIDHFKSCAMEELLKCMICYNGSSSFITFLYSRLYGTFRHINDNIRRLNRINFISLDTNITTAMFNQEYNFDLYLRDIFRHLTSDEYIVITKFYIDNKTIKEISHEIGMVQSTVYHTKNRAIEKIRNRLMAKG